MVPFQEGVSGVRMSVDPREDKGFSWYSFPSPDDCGCSTTFRQLFGSWFHVPSQAGPG